MTNQNRLFYVQIYVTQSETCVVKSEVEEPLLVTNQSVDTIVQSESDRRDEFHVENNGTTEIPMEIDQSEKKNEIDQSKTTERNESESKNEKSESESKENLPLGMDFATAIMEDDIEAFEAIRKLFYNCMSSRIIL